jgi:hypothetical protein
MILAYHGIFTAYGFWLPNDPRGSWSDFVAAWELLKFGKATKTGERRSLARDPHDRQLRFAAKEALHFPPVEFSDPQIDCVARGFQRAIDESGYVLHACAIMATHCHVVVERHERSAERIIGHLKTRASQQLEADGLHPHVGHFRPDGKRPSPWADGCWKVFLDDAGRIGVAIDYVEDNPIREGRPAQRWPFVVPFVG